MLERLLRRDRVEDDPEHDRVVEVGEDVPRERPASRAGDARRSDRSAATAVKSKYAHHSAATPAKATTTESAYVASRSSSDVPIPIATIDSPSAMITISAKRSAKWDGETLPFGARRPSASRRRR